MLRTADHGPRKCWQADKMRIHARVGQRLNECGESDWKSALRYCSWSVTVTVTVLESDADELKDVSPKARSV